MTERLRIGRKGTEADSARNNGIRLWPTEPVGGLFDRAAASTASVLQRPYRTESTADLCWALLLAAAPRVPQTHAYTVAGRSARLPGPRT